MYPLLDQVGFTEVLVGSKPIGTAEFDAWHKRASEVVCARDARVVIGWATKLINVYLKTAGYVGGLGRPGLKGLLHPPIDAGLWNGLAERFQGRTEILDRVHCVRRIKDIGDYPTYLRIIEGCRMAATELDCLVIFQNHSFSW